MWEAVSDERALYEQRIRAKAPANNDVPVNIAFMLIAIKSMAVLLEVPRNGRSRAKNRDAPACCSKSSGEETLAC